MTLAVGCTAAPAGLSQPSEASPSQPSAAPSAFADPAPLLPDGIWVADLSTDDLLAAGSAGDADPGLYRLIFDGSRARVELVGEWQCDADAKTEGGAVRLSWHPAMNCGGFDVVEWRVDGDALHLSLAYTSGNEAGTVAILETEAFQPVDGDAELTWSEGWITCSNPNGGACLDELAAGTYTTSSFEIPLRYTVPEGWWNYEDLPGNFLLVPPSGSLDGVDAGTSDYIAVLDGVAAQAPGCTDGPAPGVGRTPEAMMAFFGERSDLEVTDPQPIQVGGLEGLVADITHADSHTERCPHLPADVGPFGLLIVGVGPADFNHGVFGELAIRLYLLTGPRGETVAIEVDDLPGGESLDALTDVAEAIEFMTNE